MNASIRGLLVMVLAYLRVLAPPSEARDELIAEIENALEFSQQDNENEDRRVA